MQSNVYTERQLAANAYNALSAAQKIVYNKLLMTQPVGQTDWRALIAQAKSTSPES